MKNKVYFITGVSQGLGLEMAKSFLSKGHKVAGTTRNIKKLNPELLGSENFLPLEVNLLDSESISPAVKQTQERFGRIDVLINNAGYAMFGAIEETSDLETRKNFDVNVFGLLNVLRGVLPVMRQQKQGHIFNIASIGGFVGSFPGAGIYCSTKFAVAGLTEGLKADVKEFGIHVTLVYPGYFRTGFLHQDSMMVPKSPIAEYEAARSMVKAHQNDIHKNQPGDPLKFAEVIYQASQSDLPPFHLFIGKDSYSYANNKISEIAESLDKNKEWSLSTDFEI